MKRLIFALLTAFVISLVTGASAPVANAYAYLLPPLRTQGATVNADAGGDAWGTTQGCMVNACGGGRTWHDWRGVNPSADR
jgi:hypothetical protein